MQSYNSGVMVTPNNSRIKAKILRVTQSEQYADKWQLEFEILELQNVTGASFACVGEKVEGFTFRAAWDIPLPAVVESDAEYIGGSQKGLFQLTNLQPCQ
jgi:hypothetical protein